MKVLISTKKMQGARMNDFSWVNEGELVRFALECDSDKGNIDGPCGCRRSMSGFDGQKATTTFRVVEVDMTFIEFTHELNRSIKTAGWKRSDAAIMEEAGELVRIAECYPLETILEKRGDIIQNRQIQVRL